MDLNPNTGLAMARIELVEATSAAETPPNSPSQSKSASKVLPVYQYWPLQGAGSIRMVELLPGSFSDPIDIQIHHRTLSDLPGCHAVSYMWGDPSRIYDVFVNGKTVKVTASALKVLQRLRTPETSQLIWIDGICINQEDLGERSQQVSLMRNIYQSAKIVLIWIGDETKYTEKPFEIAKDLSQGYEEIISTRNIEDNGFRQFKTTADIPKLSELENLTREPLWEGVMDIFTSRNYFKRLWIVQEIALSTKAVVVCGGHRISWEIFYKAAICIWYCHFLQVGIRDYTILKDIKHIGDTKDSTGLQQLPVLLTRFSDKQVYESRDRVFAILGMLPRDLQDPLLQVDYAKPVERVFQDATEYLITHYQSLDHFSRLHFDPVVRSEYQIPSWVETCNVHAGRFTEKYPPHLMQALKLKERKVSISGNVLTAFGIIIDTIDASLPNFTDNNFKNIVLDLFGFFLSTGPGAGSSDVDRVTKAAQKTLKIINPFDIDRYRNEKAFFELLSKYMLSDLGVDASVVEKNPKLKNLAASHPKIKGAYPEEIENDKSIQDVVKEDETLKWMLDQTKTENEPEYENQLKWEVLDVSLGVGRNIFLGKMGYCGVGPAGKAGADGEQAAVQSGDVLALVYGAPVPMILRAQDDGLCTIVGSCHVGNLREIQSPIFEGCKLPEPVCLKIR